MIRVWTKRLGQRHYTRDGMTETLCGRPMLGNNYASIIPESEQEECEECVEALEGDKIDVIVLKKPDDIVKVHNTLFNIFGE